MAGPGLILFFVVFSALRDVYFRDALHALDFFEVIIIAFSICTLVFMGVAVARGQPQPGALAGRYAHRRRDECGDGSYLDFILSGAETS